MNYRKLQGLFGLLLALTLILSTAWPVGALAADDNSESEADPAANTDLIEDAEGGVAYRIEGETAVASGIASGFSKSTLTVRRAISKDGHEYEVKKVTFDRIGNADINGFTSVNMEKALQVTEIADNAFKNWKLTTVKFPPSLAIVGAGAFYNCPLTSIDFPATLTSIGNSAFEKCSLSALVLPTALTSMGAKAFASNQGTKLNNIDFGGSAATIGDSAFEDWKAPQTLSGTEKLTSIGKYAFNGCTNLKGALDLSGASCIGEFAFYNCAGLQTVKIGSGDDETVDIADKAFLNCSGLTTVELSGIKSIGQNTFNLTGTDSNLKIQYNGPLASWESLQKDHAVSYVELHYQLEITTDNKELAYNSNTDGKARAKVSIDPMVLQVPDALKNDAAKLECAWTGPQGSSLSAMTKTIAENGSTIAFVPAESDFKNMTTGQERIYTCNVTKADGSQIGETKNLVFRYTFKDGTLTADAKGTGTLKDGAMIFDHVAGATPIPEMVVEVGGGTQKYQYAWYKVQQESGSSEKVTRLSTPASLTIPGELKRTPTSAQLGEDEQKVSFVCAVVNDGAGNTLSIDAIPAGAARATFTYNVKAAFKIEPGEGQVKRVHTKGSETLAQSMQVTASGGYGSYIWTWYKDRIADGNRIEDSQVTTDANKKSASYNPSTAEDRAQFKTAKAGDQFTYVCQVADSKLGTIKIITFIYTVCEPLQAVPVPETKELNYTAGDIAIPPMQVAVSGGLKPYGYKWLMQVALSDNTSAWIDAKGGKNLETHTPAASDFDDLSTGNTVQYKCLITDAAGEQVKNDIVFKYTVTSPAELSAPKSEALTYTQASDIASMVTKAEGGVKPYKYAWYRGSDPKTAEEIKGADKPEYTPEATEFKDSKAGDKVNFICRVSDSNTADPKIAETIFTYTVQGALNVTSSDTAVNYSEGMDDQILEMVVTPTGASKSYNCDWYRGNEVKEEAKIADTSGKEIAEGASTRFSGKADIAQLTAANPLSYVCVITDKVDSKAKAEIVFTYTLRDQFKVTAVYPEGKSVFEYVLGAADVPQLKVMPVGGTGAANWSFVWKRDGQVIEGANEATYRPAPADFEHLFNDPATTSPAEVAYTCEVTDSGPPTQTITIELKYSISRPAQLTATADNVSLRYTLGGTAQPMHITAVGGISDETGYSYQWSRIDADGGQTELKTGKESTYIPSEKDFGNAQAGSFVGFVCVVSDNTKPTAERADAVQFTYIVQPRLEIEQPQNLIYAKDAGINPMRVQAAGASGTYTYSWYRGAKVTDAPISEQTGAEYAPAPAEFTNAVVGKTMQYTCKVADKEQPDVSDAVTFTYDIRERFSAAATDGKSHLIYYIGGSLPVLSVTPTGGTGNPTYTWYRGSAATGSAIATAQTYELTEADVKDISKDDNNAYSPLNYVCHVDDSGVWQDVSFTCSVREAPPLKLTAQESLDYYPKVSISSMLVAAEGGIGPYTFEWYKGDTAEGTLLATMNGESTGAYTPQRDDFTGLDVGAELYYTCRVSDSARDAIRISTVTFKYTVAKLESPNETTVQLTGPADNKAAVGAAITVSATLEGWPEGTQVRWQALGCGNPTPNPATGISTSLTPREDGILTVQATVEANGVRIARNIMITVGTGVSNSGGINRPAPTTGTDAPTQPPASAPVWIPNNPSTVVPPQATPTPIPATSASPDISTDPGTSDQPDPARTTTPTGSEEPGTQQPSAVPTEGPLPSASTVRPIQPLPAASATVTVTTSPNVNGSIILGVPISTQTSTTPVALLSTLVQIPSGATIEVRSVNNELVDQFDPLATGHVVHVVARDGSILSTSTVVVKGDVLGTGRLNIAQLARLAKACTGQKQLEGVYREAGDLSGNSRIDIGDLVQIARKLSAS